MQRDIEKNLLEWQHQPERFPLLVRGARQVGKSYVVEKFGKNHFAEVVVINFELQPEFIHCFNTLEPQEILTAIRLLTSQEINPGHTLLFLDEIQDCPNAIRALRYFKEKMPDLHVVGAGSLLEFVLNDADFRMPVGRVQSIYLKPVSFKEYLQAKNQHALREFLESCTLETIINPAVHQEFLKLMREYMILGGMPAVLKEYIRSGNLTVCQNLQTMLLNNYRNDFGKYGSRADIKHLSRLFEKIPGFIAQNFKYSKIDPDTRSREIKKAVELLEKAGLIHPIYHTSSSGLPLESTVNEKKFKLLFVDVGLVMRASRLSMELLFEEDVLLLNRGIIAEQLAGQELLAYQSPLDEAKLYYWQREERSSQAEVDFVTNVHKYIVPIEVKAGTTGQLKSLHSFMKEKFSPTGVRISQQPLGFKNNILSLPLYMLGELPRLINQIRHSTD